ncbi:unnamed protein product, partial [Rotaria magnacalcarata]
DVCSIWSNDWKFNVDLKDLIHTNVKPAAGQNAGKFSKIHVNEWDECVAQCCQFSRCNVAYWVSSTCLHIECSSDEMCQPIEMADTHLSDDVFYLRIRSVRLTAAAADYDDTGFDECNETKLCPMNEKCEQVSINAELKRNVCLCDGDGEFRRIKGVCRQYLPRTKPCAVYEADSENNHNDDDLDTGNRGQCRKNEECLPPSDRAKHGYCQCKLGFTRLDSSRKCVVDNKEEQSTEVHVESSTKSISSSSLGDFIVEAGDDQIITLPKDEVDLNGRVLHKSNKSEVDLSILNSQNLNLLWSLKTSTD